MHFPSWAVFKAASGALMSERPISQEISTNARSIVELLPKTIQNLSELQFQDRVGLELSSTIPATDSTITETFSRAQTICRFLQRDALKKRSYLVPFSLLENLNKEIEKLYQHASAISEQFEKILESNARLLSFNYDNFHTQSPSGNHNTLGPFKNFWACTDEILRLSLSIFPLITFRYNKTLDTAGESFDKLFKTLSDRLSFITDTHVSIEKASEEVHSYAQKTKADYAETHRLMGETASDRKTVQDYVSDASQKHASIKDAASSASELSQKVEDYAEKFNDFDQKLLDRINSFEEIKSTNERMVYSLSEKESEVESLTERALSMLSVSTSAGLASHFKTMVDELTHEMRWAGYSFYTGIVFLFISALPLLAFILLPLIGPFLSPQFPMIADVVSNFSPSDSRTGFQYLGEVVARLVILVPAAWLVRFSAIRFASLFRLKEHYAFKYSMAVSIEGFKKEAPSHSAEITASVLELLSFNPADKLDASHQMREGHGPMPILNHLLEKIRRE